MVTSSNWISFLLMITISGLADVTAISWGMVAGREVVTFTKTLQFYIDFSLFGKVLTMSPSKHSLVS